ncbi:probable E3 SUMO-protein ligase RNF212 [Lytechinus pictus]|uniref:probable E3 SUMO-protein ligase RNF212 n=1 Tax=Lytechinus pictus TaxID=7653 RepID=UPI0030B9C4A1
MTDWVHCNTCFRQPGSGPKFALTNCGHIYCGDCLETSTKDKCKMCGNPCTSITLSAKMKPDVEIYFTDPAEILKKHQKQLIMVLDFQKNHRQRLTSNRREVISRHISILESAKERMKEMDCEINRLREENRKLRSLVSGSPGPNAPLKCSQRQLTPGRGMNSSPASSISSMGRMAHKTPSPSKGRGSSPFNKRPYPTTPTAMDVSKGSIQSPQVVTPGPARYCIRTPPSGGRMGTITPTSCGSMMPSKINTPGTPGLSPISNSPTAYHQRGGYGTHERKNTPGAGGDHAMGRKQIQLNYTPNRSHPVLGMSVSASQP